MQIFKISVYASVCLIVLLQGCDESGTESPYLLVNKMRILQGNIKQGTITTINNQVFIKDDTSGFNIRRLFDRLNTYKIYDIYIEKMQRDYDFSSSNNDHLSKLLPKYPITMSKDFQGTVHIFLNLTSTYKAGATANKGDVFRYFAYGPKLADALKNTHRITHMGKHNTYPVGAGEPVVIDHAAEPDSVRKLMQAAIATKDPRLLVIERTDPADKVSIYAFGKTTKIDAGETYEWKFGKAQLNELRKFVVKR